MAKPILKIKTGISGKPGNYTQTLTNGIVTATSGLTAGELGANLAAGSYGFYIGNTFGQAITFGCEVTIDSTLGGISPSDAKIPTQKALKTYIAAAATTAAPAKIMSRYSSGDLAVSGNISVIQSFDTSELSTISGLAYGGVVGLNGSSYFTNTSDNPIHLLICYQITWTGFTSTQGNQSYASREIVRSAWIQVYRPSYDNLTSDMYGFTSLLCPLLASTNTGALTGTQNSSATIELLSGHSFAIQCKNHGTAATSTTNTATINIGSGSITNFNRATRIQIVKV
jgi:hypothetical protein